VKILQRFLRRHKSSHAGDRENDARVQLTIHRSSSGGGLLEEHNHVDVPRAGHGGKTGRGGWRVKAKLGLGINSAAPHTLHAARHVGRKSRRGVEWHPTAAMREAYLRKPPAAAPTTYYRSKSAAGARQCNLRRRRQLNQNDHNAKKKARISAGGKSRRSGHRITAKIRYNHSDDMSLS